MSILTEERIKEDLATAYRLLAYFRMDDLTYTHLSARVPGQEAYFIAPLGLLFEEVFPQDLLKVSLAGELLEGADALYNQTGFVIHGSVYRHRPDVNAVFHLHTIAGVAVSAMACGLLPISQFSFHFYQRLGYHDYDSLALSHDRHGEKLAQDLGPHPAMLLRNHGTLTCGTTVPEAFFFTFYLEKACRTQCAALHNTTSLVYPEAAVCEQAAQDMRRFEADLGQRDWEALCRLLRRTSGGRRFF